MFEKRSYIEKRNLKGERRVRVGFVQTSETKLLKAFLEEKIYDEYANKNDYLICLIEDCIAGILKITEEKSDEEKQIEFLTIFLEENRKKIIGESLGILIEEWGIEYERFIERRNYLSENASKRLLQELKTTEDDYGFLLVNADWLLEEAEKREERKERIKKAAYYEEIANRSTRFREHTKTQYFIKKIGWIMGVDTWIATNDKKEEVYNRTLGEGSADELVLNGTEQKEARKRISLIDAIWVNDQNQPVAAFECELSTNIYSGLLRMSDLLAESTNKNLTLYIVAPEEKRNKFIKEIHRPIFKKIGLEKITYFVSTEELENIYETVKGLEGCIDYLAMKRWAKKKSKNMVKKK